MFEHLKNIQNVRCLVFWLQTKLLSNIRVHKIWY
jgi:hypothetical protein